MLTKKFDLLIAQMGCRNLCLRVFYFNATLACIPERMCLDMQENKQRDKQQRDPICILLMYEIKKKDVLCMRILQRQVKVTMLL